MGATWTKYINSTVNPAPLAGFRLSFGLVLLASLILFYSRGCLDAFYISPKFHFAFYGLPWIKPLGNFTYVIFAICCIAATGVMVGYKYRWCIIAFFLSFTYLSLMDMSLYLNQYYLISSLSFLMIFLPANTAFSFDSLWSRKSYKTIPKWCVDSLKLFLGLVFIFKGIGTLNSDWLIKGEPFRTWLTANAHHSVLGEQLMSSLGWALTLSWTVTVLSLALPFLLLQRKLRFISFLILLFFYFCLKSIMPEPIFPFILVISTLIFFSSAWHHAVIRIIRQLLSPIQYGLKLPTALKMTKDYAFHLEFPKIVLGLFFIVQLVLPLRYVTYPGELYWTEDGLRHSWRSSLMDKKGHAYFRVKDLDTDKTFVIDNKQFLTVKQEEKVAANPDLILQYAHRLGDYFKAQGHKNIQVFVNSEAALNGRPFAPFINPDVDLYKERESLKGKKWILPFTSTIKGL